MKSAHLPRSGTGRAHETGVSGELSQESPTLRCRGLNVHKVSGSFRKQRGAAAVEFALVAPVFVLLLFGMIEYGRMVMVQQMVTNATREGARRAVLDGITTQDVKDSVRDYCLSGKITVNESEINVNPDPSTADFGDPIAVTVQIPFSRVSWLPAPWFLGSTNLSAASVMRRESVQ